MQDAASAKLGVVRDLTAAERLDSVYVVLATLAAALTALPFSKLVLGDDSSYAMTARTFAATGHLAYNGWAAPSLGWQVLWGALFLKLFGDSGPSLIVSMIVVGLVAIFLWHRVLLHFGISRRNAAIVALAFAVSPLYLTLIDSFVTDIPGFLSLALCVTLCQRAVLARTNRATVLWLLSACAVNLVDGSVRQICWLGALVMVPSTAWLLRTRRGALWAGAASIVAAPAVIAAYLHWYLVHAYVIPERYLAAPLTLGVLLHGVSEWSLALLLLTMVIAPVAIAWVLQRRLLSFAAKVRVGLAMALAALYLFSRMHHPAALQAKLVFPWLESIYEGMGFPYGKAVLKTPALLGLFGRSVISVLVVGASVILLELLWRYCLSLRANPKPATRGMFWILGPYALAYMAAVSGRAMFASIQDRYLLVLAAIVMVWLVRLYELRSGPRLPAASVIVTILIALFSMAANGTRYSQQRAFIHLDQRWRASGMPRHELAEGFAMDLNEQISDGGHINYENFESIPGGYDPSVPLWNLPAHCGAFYQRWFSKIRPKYFVEPFEDPHCFVKTDFPAEPYTAWLPPFHRKLVVLGSASPANAGK